ncbi:MULTISPECIES: ABC transporter permease [Erwiniaceae]|uniref:ABC transporter permease n=1 Tax=Enterobacter agglomerans TaxID=549 RepID=A0ACC5RKT7_ENTAG|nr:ABC transporter permease [Pantoea agglomerans]MBK4725326.1 ABC transporter permease [Pantoea agglomerans]
MLFDRLHGIRIPGFSHPLAQALGQRVLIALLLLWSVSVLIFLSINALPGDFAAASAGQNASPEAMAAIRQSLGLDQPLVIRYFSWVTQLLQGDLGISWGSHQPVGTLLWPRLINSLSLAGGAMLLAVPVALGGGLLAVRYLHRLPDRVLQWLSLVTLSLPEFFIGYLLIEAVVVQAGLTTFPSTLYDDMTFSQRFSAMILPMCTLALSVLAHLLRSTRSALLQLTDTPWMETARLKGLAPLRILLKHAAPNAIAPVVTVIAINLAALIVGAMIVEVIFVYPGMGQYMVDAVTVRDIPVVQACGLVFASLYIVINLLVDGIVLFTNPRLRYPR